MSSGGWKTAFTELVGCTVPIQQAGFGSSANVALAGAVSEAGGLGMLGGTMADAPALAAAVDAVEQITTRPVGVNFVAPFFDRDRDRETLRTAAARCRVVEFFYGEPDAALVREIQAEGALAGWQVGSVSEAEHAVDAGVDIVVLQGIEAGGHVRATSGLWPMLIQAVESLPVPVIAAGGIASARGVAAALAAGAAGVRMGTRFVASLEADFHPLYKAALLSAGGRDTVYTERFGELWPEAPHRVLRSSILAAEAAEGPTVGSMQAGAQRIEVPRFAGFAPTGDATGDIAAMACFAGEGVGEIETLAGAGEIVGELAAGAAELLGAAWARAASVATPIAGLAAKTATREEH